MTEQLESSIPNFLMASILTSYPDEESSGNIQALLADKGLMMEDALRKLTEARVANLDILEDHQSKYIELFDRGRVANPLYETEYARNRAMGKGTELADISGFYRAFGLELTDNPTYRDMLDHVAIELEFYALLLLKHRHLMESADLNGCEVVFDARKKFLKDHLGRFVDAIVSRPGVLENPFYHQVFSWCRDLINEECRVLKVEPLKVDWLGDRADEMGCAGSCAS